MNEEPTDELARERQQRQRIEQMAADERMYAMELQDRVSTLTAIISSVGNALAKINRLLASPNNNHD